MKLSVICLLVVVLVVFLNESDAIFFGRGRRGRAGGALLAAGVGVAGLAGLAALAAVASGGIIFVGRKKREIDNTVNVQLEREELMEEIMSYFDLALEFDEETYCVPRTFCEIMATPESGNSDLVKFIHSIYTKDSPLGHLIGTANHKGANAILEAGLIGKYSRDSSACAAAFSRCTMPLNMRQKLMEDSFLTATKN